MATSELTIAQGIHNWVKSYEKKTTRGGHTPAVLDEDTFESNVTGFQKFEEEYRVTTTTPIDRDTQLPDTRAWSKQARQAWSALSDPEREKWEERAQGLRDREREQLVANRREVVRAQ